MTTYPLPTLACTITSAGIFAPAYQDILASLQASFTTIYGADTYLGNDSQDGQWLAILAQAVYDGNQADVATYNAFSPATAQGAGLSSVVKINGLQRETASNSSVPITVSGVVGTQITNGIITDTFKNPWNLPSSVLIPGSGAIVVTATAAVAGNLTAAPQTWAIATPVYGWASAVSSVYATPGAPVETDPQLRKRQSVSTSLPALSVLAGITAALSNLAGVQEVQPYENDTGTTNTLGISAHSIAMVVEGGSATTIAQTIELTKTPGTGTYGTTSETVLDSAGVPITIYFSFLTLVTTSVRVVAHALANYVATTGTALEAAVASFLTTLAIGQTSYLTKLYAPATLAGDDATSTSGLTQPALDLLSNTYNVTAIYQARSDMVNSLLASGGASSMTITNVANYATNSIINFLLSNGNYQTAIVSGVVGNVVSFSPAIPSGASVAIGTLIYVAGDLAYAYAEAATAAPGNIILSIS